MILEELSRIRPTTIFGTLNGFLFRKICGSWNHFPNGFLFRKICGSWNHFPKFLLVSNIKKKTKKSPSILGQYLGFSAKQNLGKPVDNEGSLEFPSSKLE